MATQNIDLERVRRAAAQMGWDMILDRLCPVLRPVLDKPTRRMACPGPNHTSMHGDAFRLYGDFRTTGGGVCNTCGSFQDGFALIGWINSWDFIKTAKAVDEILGGGSVPVPHRTADTAHREKKGFRDDKLIKQKLQEAWQQTVGLGHPDAEPARLYLINRGLVPIQGPLSDLRFHREMPYWEQTEENGKTGYKNLGNFPTLLAIVRQPDGQPVTLHRTYLTQDGHKAPVPAPKKQMTAPSYKSISGAMIRLDPPAAILHVTEGIENALAVRNLMAGRGHSCGSCLNATLLAKLVPPPEVKLVCQWGDYDLNGAGKLAVDAGSEHLRELGIRSIQMMPKFAATNRDTKVDWLDVVNRMSIEGLRNHEMFRTLMRIIDKESLAAGIGATSSASAMRSSA